jgi:hypothetical protein
MNAPADIAPIGHNAPPVFEAFSLHIDDLYEEAKHFLDGEPVQTQEQADAVAVLLTRLRTAANDADDARKAEKRPHDDAAKAVQEKWRPLLTRADLAVSTCKQAIAPFLQSQEEERRRAVEAANQEASQRAEAARQAALSARPDSLADREALERLRKGADQAQKAANRAEKQRPQAKGEGRATTLRTSYCAELTDPLAFGKWLWEHRRADYLEWLMGWAQSECRHGPKDIPGVKVHTDRKAV